MTEPADQHSSKLWSKPEKGTFLLKLLNVHVYLKSVKRISWRSFLLPFFFGVCLVYFLKLFQREELKIAFFILICLKRVLYHWKKRSQIYKWGNFDILIVMFSLHDIQSKASICLLTFKERKCISCLSIWYFFNVNLLFRLWLTFKILSQLMDYSVCRCFN